ncbi:MAG: hypothetical protein Q8850_02885, partial [Candidatus Phytoplasma australasiaticum]|nr:hypothetical protein [Candidatus Phytoplasma australasiaticum]
MPNNLTMAQIKKEKEKKITKSKVKETLFASVSITIFTRIMALKSAKVIWDYLNKKIHRRGKNMRHKVLNLIRIFELQKMKESELSKSTQINFLVVNK